MKSAWNIAKQTFSEFMEDRALRLSAAMAYYAIFSIGPLLILIVAVAGLVMGEESVRQQVHTYLQGAMGGRSAQMIESMMASRSENSSLIASIVSGIALLLGAAGVFGQLQDALNTIWEVKAKPGQGIWGFVRDRFLSMTMVLGIGFLLLISMALTTMVNAFSSYLTGLIGVPEGAAQVLNEVASFLVITLLFALIYKLLPDVKVGWRYVWIGALGTAALFVLGKFLLGFYLGKQSDASAYGAGTAFVMVLLYIYYSSVILFLGAEFTQVYARYKGAAIEPSKHAVPVSERERENEGVPREFKPGPRRAGPQPAYAAGRSSGAPAAASSDAAQTSAQKSALTSAQKTSEIPMAKKRHTTTNENGGGDRPAVARPPLRQVEAQPWSFVTLALGMGVLAGVALKFKAVRRGLRIYALVRRFV